MKILVIDNYDSFVFNIVHLLKELDQSKIEVVKNDEVKIQNLTNYDQILLSPGPGIPSQAGKMMEVLDKCQSTHSILGVCLGHQAIGEYFGLQLKQLPTPLHGIAGKLIIKKQEPLLNGLKSGNAIGHYHSWVLENNEQITSMEVIAEDDSRNIMAIQHQSLPLFGVQFHPESLLTENGKKILSNWLTIPFK